MCFFIMLVYQRDHSFTIDFIDWLMYLLQVFRRLQTDNVVLYISVRRFMFW
jgi:hypothetical protein